MPSKMLLEIRIPPTYVCVFARARVCAVRVYGVLSITNEKGMFL